MPRRRRGVVESTLSPLVVDASICVPLLAHELGSPEAEGLLRQDRLLIATDLLMLEIANALWKKVRRGDVPSEDVARGLAAVRSIGIALYPIVPLIDAAAGLSVARDHPVYDCVYVALAREREADLATQDKRMARLARSEGVKLWSP